MMTEKRDFEEILKVIKDRYDSIINGLSLRFLWTMNLRQSRKTSVKRSGEIMLLPEENI